MLGSVVTVTRLHVRFLNLPFRSLFFYNSTPRCVKNPFVRDSMSGPDYSVPVLLNLIQVNLVSFYLPALDYLSGVVTARIIKKGIFFRRTKRQELLPPENQNCAKCYRLQIIGTQYLIFGTKQNWCGSGVALLVANWFCIQYHM